MGLYKYAEQYWLLKNRVAEGTVVRVTRKAEYGEDGWDNVWVADMDAYIGKEFPVGPMDSETSSYVSGVGIPLIDENDYDMVFYYQFPYFVLEVV